MSHTRAFVALFGVGLLCANASALTLYDGSAGTSPQSQGWLSYFTFPGTGVETVSSTKTTYDSTASFTEQGGFSNYTPLAQQVNASFPPLDRNSGFTISIDLRELSESHNSSDRAGLSLIVLASDHQGVELGFWPTQIWAQAVGFTHSVESVLYDPTAASKTYDLTFAGSNYTLSANGTQILTGPLRDYSSFGVPYTLPNYIFVGDDTTSAIGSFEMSRLAVTVPEPVSASLLALGAFAMVGRRR